MLERHISFPSSKSFSTEVAVAPFALGILVGAEEDICAQSSNAFVEFFQFLRARLFTASFLIFKFFPSRLLRLCYLQLFKFLLVTYSRVDLYKFKCSIILSSIVLSGRIVVVPEKCFPRTN